jgi:hypothetical protein
MTDIAVGIVNFNTRELLRACLGSVRQEQPGTVVVVDNASSDGSQAMVKAEFPEVKLVENPSNLGYAAAANQALACCNEEYVLLLNSDAILRPGTLPALSEYLDRNPAVGIAGPRLLNPDGTAQRSVFPFPTPLDVFLDLSNLSRLIRQIPLLRNLYFRTWPQTQARPVPWTLGAALAMRRRAIEAVGRFDASYFMYYEEVDLCYRLLKMGWQTHYAPVADIVHIGGASTGQMRSDMAVQMFASLAHFYRKHYSQLRLAELTLLVALAALARLARDLILLRLRRESRSRAHLELNIHAWQRLLLGQWLKRSVFP